MTNAFNCYIRPVIESSTVVWNPTDVASTNQIERVQRSFTKRLFQRCGIHDVSYKDRLDILGLDTLENRRNVADMIFLHKCLNEHFHLNKENIYTKTPLGRPLRNSHSLRITLPFQISNTSSTFASRHINFWNNLPQEKVLLSTESFANYLQKLPTNSINAVSLLR